MYIQLPVAGEPNITVRGTPGVVLPAARNEAPINEKEEISYENPFQASA